MKALEMPFAGNRFSMFIILPKSSTCLSAVESKLTAFDLVDVERRFQMCRQSINVWMPRFKMDEAVQLSDVLQKMGIKDAFNANADFSGMNGNRDLYISEVLRLSSYYSSIKSHTFHQWHCCFSGFI